MYLKQQSGEGTVFVVAIDSAMQDRLALHYRTHGIVYIALTETVAFDTRNRF
jgi:hypothetical protein